MGALTLSDWLDKLQLQHPVEIDLGLDRVSQVAAELDLLEAVPTTITVAGTNGKGSVVEVLSSVAHWDWALRWFIHVPPSPPF